MYGKEIEDANFKRRKGSGAAYILYLALEALHCARFQRQGRSKGEEDGWGVRGREALSSGTGSLGGIRHGPVRRNLRA